MSVGDERVALADGSVLVVTYDFWAAPTFYLELTRSKSRFGSEKCSAAPSGVK